MKNEIICPHCKKRFNIDDTALADIVRQVRDNEFDNELAARVQDAVRLAVSEAENKTKTEAAHKQAKIAELQAEKESAAQLAAAHAKNEAQVDIAQRDSEIATLRAQLKEKADEIQLVAMQTKSDLQKSLAQKSETIATLEQKLAAKDIEKNLAVTTALSDIEKQRTELVHQLASKDSENKLLEATLKDKYESQLRLKDEQIAQYKDFKAKQSVKLLGESLEQHCEIAFRQWQTTGAFHHVSFGKDNDTARSGTKGDYIYRETDEAGNEILSIMFDMKNEADESTTKKKNEDHFKKLDKDRSEKACEYAVLVSMLEADNELYAGITDVSYVYDKMYVVRPQFFMAIIAILRGAARAAMQYKTELAQVREQNIDVTNFERDLQTFQSGFMKNVKDSSSKFNEAMDGIDATIKKLEAVKEALRLSNKHLLTAGNKVEDVSVKRFTKNNPTMSATFAALQDDTHKDTT